MKSRKKIVRLPRKEKEAFEYEKLYRELVNS